MTPLRFSMMTATLLAFAATVHGQAPPEPTCPGMGMPTWLAPYLQQTVQTWNHVRGMCSGQTGDKDCQKLASCVTGAAGGAKCCETIKTPACCCATACAGCESCKAKKDAPPQAQVYQVFPLPVLPSNEVCPPSQFGGHAPTRTCQPAPPMPPPVCPALQAERERKIAEFYERAGHAGAAQFYYELMARRYGQLTPPMPPMPVQAPYQTVQVQAVPVPNPGFCPQSPPCTGPTPIAIQYVVPSAPSVLVPPPPPVGHQVVQVQTITGQPMFVPPPPVVHRADCVIAAAAPKHAHLVTPDLEAHCARMTHRGDTIVLEGDVILINKKHAQPIRIEAQRAVINMKDSSVSVEGAGSTSGFGVTRTSAVTPVVERVQVEERCVQVIRLRNAAAADVERCVVAHLANGRSCGDATVQAEPVSNSILISASPESFERLIRLISEFDRQPPATLRSSGMGGLPGR